MTSTFKLRFPAKDLVYWSQQYDHAYDAAVESLSGEIRGRGFYTKEDLVAFANWKSPRIRRHILSNAPENVEEVTRWALTTHNESLRIGSLMLLKGVSWAMASVLLHFGHRDPYPILDFRALWSLGQETYLYSVDYWLAYTAYIRTLAVQNHLSLRQLDRALWRYSKENQL